MGRIFRMGEDWGKGGQDRVSRAMAERATVIPQLSILPKDHKLLLLNGTFPSRPVISGSMSYNDKLSEMTNMLVESILKSNQQQKIHSVILKK